MTRRAFLAAPAAFAPLAAKSPNIVLIVSDDHGWADYGFLGHPHVRTPHIDRLASESLVFTRGYVPSSLCRPSLASIMTGLYPHQHLITGNDPPGDARDAGGRAAMTAVFRRSISLAHLLGSRGYRSHQSGKWWEGACQCCFTDCMTHGDVSRGGRHGDDGLKIGRETMQPILDFIDASQGRPFFVWYAPFLPHTPHNPPERLLAYYRAKGLPAGLARYYAMIEWLDETVGLLLGHLERRNLARDTIVLYLADNGWVQLEGAQPLHASRAKMSPYDAGVRTPILVRWPGVIDPRREEHRLASSIDLAPTILRACGLSPPRAMPGVDLRDRRAIERRRAIFGGIFVHTSRDIENPARNLKYRWIVRDRWKLIVPYGPNLSLEMWDGQGFRGWSEEAEFYDVVADPGERDNRAAAQPRLARSLRGDLDRWWPAG